MLKKPAVILALIGIISTCFLVSAQEIPYKTGKWDATKYGNHRAVLHISSHEDKVWVHLPWRRRDKNPDKKRIVIIDAATGHQLKNVFPIHVNQEHGDILLQPRTIPGDYYVYYLNNEMSGRSNYPTVIYPPPEKTLPTEWFRKVASVAASSPGLQRENFPQAEVKEFQSIDELNSFYPMEVIATHKEISDLLHKNPDSAYLLFPEDRKFPIRMTDHIPFRWIKIGAGKDFQGQVFRGEYYTFQIGVYACRQEINNLTVRFSALSRESDSANGIIPAASFTCFNTSGKDWQGNSFTREMPVPQGKVQALWCGFKVPLDAQPGDYFGSVVISPQDLSPTRIELQLEIRPGTLPDAGDSEPWRHSRLRWLDSTLAFDSGIVPPYTPMSQDDNTFTCLGRKVRLGDMGFPVSIQSFFTEEMTSIGRQGRELLAAPVSLQVKDEKGFTKTWRAQEFNILNKAAGEIVWESSGIADDVELECRSRMEFDGYMDFQVKLTANRKIKVKDICLEIPLNRAVTKYMMGMGVKGGLRRAGFKWKWDQEKNQDSIWLGDINAGIQVSLRDNRYSRPLNTNFYLLKPLVMPRSWWNKGKGGCEVIEKDADTVMLRFFSGDRSIANNEELFFYFSFLVTPFRPLDTKKQWSTRFYHRYEDVDKIAARGANTINVHHATAVNPYINYPFLRPAEMKAYIEQAHARDMQVKIYYTVRELSNRAPELFALRSLGDEIFFPGEGGGFSWLQEHLGGNYIAAWFVPDLKDAAIINSGVSRWHNYYVEGLNWLVNNIAIDGLYIDDVAFDRTTMKRVRKVLDRNRPDSLIDLHSANQFNVRDGYANSANLYLEHFPYIDRLWFGEYFDYDSAPDFWLIEVSGIPFGLMGEMLQDGGNPWRGMLFGMTSRLPWAGDPSELWRVWDEFGMQDSEMIGFWAPSCPITTGHEKILATVYKKEGAALISIASWAEKDVSLQLKIDWSSLGLEREEVRIIAPRIPGFQDPEEFGLGDSILVKPGRGWLLHLY